ncbi:hypothetical protein SAMN05660420_02711 [Desulfuromusa kysingii]|uniref:CDP-alcohol phosphatidyltransferase n=1 Tax=Desulfuromusa kysingii TaxID=37625 RepID=A0A1H4CXH4_9BACT|nr:CDP-alcohol phosphatidyltransferase family protein [Desulfuromusa kysingii]SEA64946.1 hypothetical protein SAMN05660420_02711 [Desulfuromusa kysingii]
MTINLYKEICQKNSGENYLIDKYIYRKISIYGTMLAIKFKVSPNTVTSLSLLAALGSLFFIVQNIPGALLTGALLVFLYHYLDHVDGELARYYIHSGQMIPNMKGQYFDVLCHSFSDNLMFLCLSFALYLQFGHAYILFLGVIAMVGSSGFPEAVAAKLLCAKIINNKNLLNDEQIQSGLWLIEKKKNQIVAVNAPFFSKIKFFKIISEILGYPGVLSAIMLVCILDAIFGVQSLLGYQFDFRLLFLILSGLFRLIVLPLRSYRWMKRFEAIH